MQVLALEFGDAATWGGTMVTFVMACFAIVQGAGQRRDLRRQNELQAEAAQLQRRQIETAERRALAMEQLLAELASGTPPSVPGTDAVVPGGEQRPASSSGPPPQQQPAPFPAPVPAPAPAWGTAPFPQTEPAAAAASAAYGEPAEYGEPDEPDQLSDADDEAVEDERDGDRVTVSFNTAPLTRPSENGTPPPAGTGSRDGVPSGGYGYPQPGSGSASQPGYGYPQPAYAGAPYGGGSGSASTAWPGWPGRPEGAAQPGTPAQPGSAPQTDSAAQPAGMWRLERRSWSVYALVNTGPTTVTGVRISPASLPSYARGVPEDAVVRAGEAVEFVMAPERGKRLPAVLQVSWHGRPGTVPVPVPGRLS